MPRHELQRDLSYAREQLFDLAADVERYPEFLPGWIAVRILHRDGDVYHTEQVLGVGTFRQRFRSKTFLQKPEYIIVTSTDRVMQDFTMEWLFEPLSENGCRVTARVTLELRSKLAQAVFDRFVSHSIGSIMQAFEARAHRTLGR